MARDFGVTDKKCLKALENIREIELPQSYWDSVLALILDEQVKAEERTKALYSIEDVFFTI